MKILTKWSRQVHLAHRQKVWRSVALFVLITLAVFCVIDLIDTDSGWIQASGVGGIVHSGNIFLIARSFL